LKGIDTVLKNLKVDPKVGLTDNDDTDYQRRDTQFGSNYKPPPTVTPFCVFLLRALEDFMLRILLICACVSIVVDMSLSSAHHKKTAWIEGAAIFNAVFVVSIVGSYNDWAKDV
jgi:magnesium-transporting ATPase (P-type)